MRKCECGCGREVLGRKRFVNDAHRKRAARARTNPDTNPDTGGARDDPAASLVGAVEQLVEDFPALPSPLAVALRTLAARLEQRPDSSPLWGRFTRLLERALESWAQAQPLPDEALRAMWEIRTLCHDPTHPHSGASAVLHCGYCCPFDPYEANSARAAEACARGDHEWIRWPAGTVVCANCQRRAPDDIDPSRVRVVAL